VVQEGRRAEEARRVKTRSRLNGSDFPTGAVQGP